MKIAIATHSPDKIGGITRGFSKFFQVEETEIQVHSETTESGVPEQPFDSETYIGALNRVNNIKHILEGFDFYVSCEAGIESFSELSFNVQVVCIYDTNNQKYLWGKSSGWSIPSKDIEIIKEYNLDSYLRNKGINSIDELLGPSHSRSEFVAQATELALASRL